uniref:Double-stranded RNA-binding protein 2-like n=1 Tax=Rhizophora mucronata TaxID=61149 RepID=A0A2P2LIB1_RHIMU
MSFNGEPARTKKQAQKNAAMAAWSALKRMVQHGSSSSSLLSSSVETKKGNKEQEQVIVARLLASLKPSESKNSNQKHLQNAQDSFIPVCRHLTPPTPGLYTMHCEGWGNQRYSPEMAIYQVWQHEHLLLLQNNLLALHVPPALPPGPQMLPYMHSILPQDSCLCFPVREQESMPGGPRIAIAPSAPPLYFSDPVVSDPSRGKSTVTIQEIHEEKTEESSQCSLSMVPDNPVLGNLNAKQRFKESVDEKNKQKSIGLESKIENVQLGENQTRISDRALWGSSHPWCTHVDFQAQNPRGFGFSAAAQQDLSRSSSPRTYRPAQVMIRTAGPAPSSAASTHIHSTGPVSSFPQPQYLAAGIAAPPRMRTGPSSYSARPQPQRMEIGRLHPRFMAPAIRIRSVVPVCSAPPPRKMPSSRQEGALPNHNTKETASENMSCQK